MLTVKLFARARDLAGSDAVRLSLPPGATVADLRAELARQLPPLARLVPHLLVAMGTEYADDETPLNAQQEIACFPPVSGG